MSRPRFLGAEISAGIVVGALGVLAFWLGSVALLLIELMQAITGSRTGCSWSRAATTRA